jgi:hypothetical protein
MLRLTYDVVIFGYGHLTQQLIKFLKEKKLKVACVTDRESYSDFRDSDIDFFKYSSLIGIQIDTMLTIFSWKDSLRLSSHNPIFQRWFKSNNLISHRSFLLSSVSVYKDSKTAIDESEQNLILNVQSHKKYILENDLSRIMGCKGSSHLNLRVSNVYGLNLTHGLVSELISSIRKKSVLRLYENLDLMRDYLFAEDLFNAIYSLVRWPGHIKAINVSTGVGTSARELIQLFQEQGYEIKYELIGDSPEPLKYSSIVDCTLLRSIVTWNPTSLEVGLLKTLI